MFGGLYFGAVAVSHSGVRLCILGDRNFECKSSNQGYLLFSDLANVYNVVSCDYLTADGVKYTYHQNTLQHSSHIDHVFIGNDLKHHINNF